MASMMSSHAVDLDLPGDRTLSVPVLAVVAAVQSADIDPNGLVPDIPLRPPDEWLLEPHPDWDPAGPLVQVFDQGRVTAIVAPYDECIIDGKAGCWKPPVSATNYEYAHIGGTPTRSGDTIRTANIGGDISHFDPYQVTQAALASDHYANTATRRMVGRYIDLPPHGIVFVGMLYPGTTNRQMFDCMTSALSGDWRWIESMRDWEMVGSQLVNNPAFRPNPAKVRKLRIAGDASNVVPLRRNSAAGFYDIGAKVASLDGGCASARVVSHWVGPDDLATPDIHTAGWKAELEARVAALDAHAGYAILGAGVDEAMLEAGDDDDDTEGDDYDDDLSEIQGDECRFCNGDGCEKCGWVGYTGPEAVVAALALGPLHARIARLPKRDGDGDGFVDDGLPTMRPVDPRVRHHGSGRGRR